MALYTEKALLKMMYKKGTSAMRDTAYTGLYYEDPKRDNEKRYIVIGTQMGGQVHTTNPKRQERKLLPKKGWIPEAKKVEAATLHVAIGNMEKVSQLTKVPLKELEKWELEDWWMSTQQRVKRENLQETDSKFTQLITKALGKLEKSIDEGDYIYDFKKGRVVQIPMTGRDLSIVSGTIFDKRQLLRGEATKITQTGDQTEKHLKELARKFAELVKGPEEKIIEGQVLEDAEQSEPRELLSAGTVQAQENAGDDGSSAETEDATTAYDAVPAETRSPSGDQLGVPSGLQGDAQQQAVWPTEPKDPNA